MAGNRDSVVEMVIAFYASRAMYHIHRWVLVHPMLLEGGTFWPPMAMVIIRRGVWSDGLALYWIPANPFSALRRQEARSLVMYSIPNQQANTGKTNRTSAVDARSIK